MRILQYFLFAFLFLQQKEAYPQYAVSAFDVDMYAHFSHTTSGFTVSFINISVASGQIHWDFGDGDTSNLSNPVHTYTTAGEYVVELTITTSDICIASKSQTIVLSPSVDIENMEKANEIAAFPNPFSNTFNIVSTHFVPSAMHDLFGNTIDVSIHQIASDKFLLTSQNLTSGLYLVKLEAAENQKFYIISCIASD